MGAYSYFTDSQCDWMLLALVILYIYIHTSIYTYVSIHIYIYICIYIYIHIRLFFCHLVFFIQDSEAPILQQLWPQECPFH